MRMYSTRPCLCSPNVNNPALCLGVRAWVTWCRPADCCICICRSCQRVFLVPWPPTLLSLLRGDYLVTNSCYALFTGAKTSNIQTLLCLHVSLCVRCVCTCGRGGMLVCWYKTASGDFVVGWKSLSWELKWEVKATQHVEMVIWVSCAHRGG